MDFYQNMDTRRFYHAIARCVLIAAASVCSTLCAETDSSAAICSDTSKSRNNPHFYSNIDDISFASYGRPCIIGTIDSTFRIIFHGMWRAFRSPFVTKDTSSFVLAKESRANYPNYVGLTTVCPEIRTICYRRWFSDRTAGQIAAGVDDTNRLYVGLTGFYSCMRTTYFRFMGLTNVQYNKLNNKLSGDDVSIGLGFSLEYYIGRLGQSFGWEISTNPGVPSISIYAGFGMYFRF